MMTVSRCTPRLLAAGAALMCLSWTATVSAQTGEQTSVHAEAFGVRGPSVAQQQPPVHPPSAELDVSFRNQPVFQLGPVDSDALLAEDEALAEFRQPTRVGIVRDVIIRELQGQWHDVAGGRLWTVDIVSENAIGMRLKIIGMNLPRGAELYAYSPDDAQRVDGPLTGAGRYGHGETWTKTFWGERARIEYFQPEGVGVQGDAVPFVISGVSHWYRPLDGGARGIGNCHNDVTCFPAWQDVADAVGLITFIDGAQQFVCSGQLLSTQSNDLTPLFYTANHCITTNTIAQTAEIFWHFQTSICNGSASPSISSVDMSLLVGNSTIDYSLMMLHGTIPGNLFWVGWTTNLPPTNTPSTGVHHPGGSWKRISFGERLGGSVCGFNGSANYHRLSWDIPDGGVVEGGSSGSGIYRNDTQQLYGALFCGQSSNPCAQPSLDDDYGRFDRFYVVSGSQNILSDGPDDDFEDNNSCGQATPLTQGTYGSLVVKSTDEDWYAIQVNQNDSLSVSATFTHSRGDIDLHLLDGCDGSIVRSSTSTSDNESLALTNTGSTSTFYLRVFMKGTDTRAEYALDIDIQLGNDVCGTGVPVTEGANPFSTVGATTDGPDVPVACGFADTSMQNDIWFAYNPACSDDVTISICDADFQPKLAVYFISCPTSPNNPEPVACDEGGCLGGAQVTFAATAGFTYQVRVAGFDGQTGSGTMNISCGAAPCPADLTGDNVVDVFDLFELLNAWGTNGPGADLASPNDNVDVFDLFVLLNAWGGC